VKQIACVVAIAWSATARADGIGVIAASSEPADRAGVAAAMAAAVGQGTPRVVEDAVGVARAGVAAGAVPVAILEKFRRVQTAIDEGWRAFVRVQVELAASRLAVARTDAEALVTYPGGNVIYADASLRLGAVLAHLGRTAESQAALTLGLALDPERPISLAEFSPDVVAAVDAVRTLGRPVRAVKLTSEPPGASITVDGKDVGTAPISVALGVGQHVVVARHPLHAPRALATSVNDTTTEIALELAPDPAWSQLAGGATLGLPDRDAQQLVDASLVYADLDEVVLVVETRRRGGGVLLAQRCAGLPARCTAVVEVGHGDASGRAAGAREVWSTLRTADLRYPPSVLADKRLDGGPVDDRCKLCRSPVLWVSVGAAVAVGTVVAVVLLSGSRPPPVVAIDPSQY
jgi:hypothetical protein